MPDLDPAGEPQLRERLEVALGLLRTAGVEDDHGGELHPRPVRRVHEPGEHGEVVGAAGHGVAVEAEHVRCGVDRVGDQPAGDHRDRLQAVRERRHDPEVAAAALERPEQVGVGRLGHLDDVALCVTSSTASRLSAARPYLAISQPSPPPRVRPAIPVVEIAPPVTARPCSAVASLSSAQLSRPPRAPCGLRIDVDALHLGEVDHHRAVGDGAPGDVVAAAAHADVEPGRAREAHAAPRRPLRSGSARSPREAIDEAVVDAAGGIVASSDGRSTRPESGRRGRRGVRGQEPWWTYLGLPRRY